jgi:hypothetical protein
MTMDPQLEPGVLQKGDLLPFFEVTTVDDGRVRYADLWQRKNVVVVSLPRSATAHGSEYANEIARRSAEFDSFCAVCIVTRDAIRGVPLPGVVIADRWGEIQFLASSAAVADFPDPQELLDTLDYVQQRCPECEGESR